MGRLYVGIVCLCILSLSGCGLITFDAPRPTRDRMLGIWEAVSATDSAGTSILDKVSFPVLAYDLNDLNGFASTSGPMFMYVVYGGSNYTTIAGKIDQAFNYSKNGTNTGSWYVDTGVVSRFTVEMPLQAPGQQSLDDILKLLGVQVKYLNTVVYHKFIDVKVTLTPNDSLMTWTFDNQTTAKYYIRNAQGDPIIWDGWSTTSFGKCTFTFAKRIKSVQDLITGATK